MMNILELLYYTSGTTCCLNRLLQRNLPNSFDFKGILIYISSTINPILYNVMSKRYRTAFKNTVTMCFTCSFNTRLLAYKRSNYYFSRVNVIHRNNHDQPHSMNISNRKNTNSLNYKHHVNNNTTNNTIRELSRNKPYN